MKQCEGQLTTVSQKQSGKCCFEAKDGINNLTGLKIDKGKNANDNTEDRLYLGSNTDTKVKMEPSG